MVITTTVLSAGGKRAVWNTIFPFTVPANLVISRSGNLDLSDSVHQLFEYWIEDHRNNAHANWCQREDQEENRE